MKPISLAAAMLVFAVMPVRAQVPAGATNVTAAEVQAVPGADAEGRGR